MLAVKLAVKRPSVLVTAGGSAGMGEELDRICAII